LNIQGDEPVIDPGEINLFLDSICGAYDAYVGYAPIRNVEEFSSQKVPKFVVSELDELLFASRSAVPWGFCNSNVRSAFKQVCIYAFSVRALSYYGVVRPKSVNEIVEDIEIIRLLDKGLKVKCIKLSDNGSYPVDYESDIPVVEEILLSKYQKFRG
jgi:3-deoxy-manno-octulosonate cytidylyltransferase (CMP-KDO synthetase)